MIILVICPSGLGLDLRSSVFVLRGFKPHNNHSLQYNLCCNSSAHLAQLVEHGSYEPRVVGSSPTLSKIFPIFNDLLNLFKYILIFLINTYLIKYMTAIWLLITHCSCLFPIGVFMWNYKIRKNQEVFLLFVGFFTHFCFH